MEKITEMSGVLGGNCFQTCSYIPQKTYIDGLTKEKSLTRQVLLGASTTISYKQKNYLIKYQ